MTLPGARAALCSISRDWFNLTVSLYACLFQAHSGSCYHIQLLTDWDPPIKARELERAKTKRIDSGRSDPRPDDSSSTKLQQTRECAPVSFQYLARIQDIIFLFFLLFQVSRLSQRRLSPPPECPSPLRPPKPARLVCTCRRCGPYGKVLPKRTWYHHNPGGKAAKHEAIVNRAIEELGLLRALPRPVYEARKQSLHGDAEGMEDPPVRSSKRVAAISGSVRPMLFHDM